MRRVRLPRAIDRSVWIAIAGGLVAIGICLYQLSLPDVLTGVHGVYGGSDGYDDGVYIGVAIRLIHGGLPYRDFVFLQPPGISLFMTPIAAVGQLVGDRDALVIARIVTVAVAGLNAFLCGFIVRPKGKTAVFIASFGLACFPLAIAADDTLLLEPYLVFFCLLAIALTFDGLEVASTQRVLLGGIALGLAASTKTWAVFPIAAMLLALTPRWRSAVARSAIGVVIGLGVTTLPFFVLAPRSFLHDVLATQFVRAANGPGSSSNQILSLPNRLALMTGVGGISGLNDILGIAEIIAVTFVLIVIISLLLFARRERPLERCITFSAIVVVFGMFATRIFYDHYAYFPAAFIALFIGLSASRFRLLALSKIATFVNQHKGITVTVATVIPLGIALVLFGGVVAGETSYARTYLGNAFDYAAADDAIIPAGSCVFTDFAPLTVDINRYVSSSPTCPIEIDPLGTLLAGDNGAAPTPAYSPPPVPLVVELQANLRSANYVLLSAPFSDYLPWTPDLFTWFSAHYRQVVAEQGNYLYVHTSDFAPGVQISS